MAVYVGDTGTRIELDVGVNVDDIDTASLIMKYPSGNKKSFDLSKDSENNVLYYITGNGDLSEAGIYSLQARVNLKSGWSGGSEIVKMQVLNTL